MVDRGIFQKRFCLANFVSPSILPKVHKEKDTPLRIDFQPTKADVICGRGKQFFNFVGNRRFRVVIAMNTKRYSEAKTKMDKSVVVMSIVDSIREGSPFGGFVRQDQTSKRWYEIGDALAREKVGHALRESIKATKKRAKVTENRRGREVTKSSKSSLSRLAERETKRVMAQSDSLSLTNVIQAKTRQMIPSQDLLSSFILPSLPCITPSSCIGEATNENLFLTLEQNLLGL